MMYVFVFFLSNVDLLGVCVLIFFFGRIEMWCRFGLVFVL